MSTKWTCEKLDTKRKLSFLFGLSAKANVMMYPNSISAKMSQPAPRRSVPGETVPRRGTPRGPAGRPRPQRPRRAAPRTYPGKPQLPSFPAKPGKSAHWNYTGIVKRYARHLRIGVYGEALSTLQTYNIAEHVGAGWTKGGVCMLDWNRMASPGSQYCGPQGALNADNGPSYELNRWGQEIWMYDAVYEGWNPGSALPNRYSWRLQKVHNVTSGSPAWGADGLNSRPGYEVNAASQGVYVQPQIFPNALPWLFPDLLPVAVPEIIVAPKPIRNPWKVPRPMSPQMPDIGPRPIRAPRVSPGVLPASATQVISSPGAATRPVAGAAPARPAGPRVKERKAKMTGGMLAAWHSVGGVTEGLDFLDNIYDALPGKIKAKAFAKNGGKLSPQQKALLIYQNIDQVNIALAISNYIVDQAEDRIFGAFGKALGKASSQSSRPLGYATGSAL